MKIVSKDSVQSHKKPQVPEKKIVTKTVTKTSSKKPLDRSREETIQRRKAHIERQKAKRQGTLPPKAPVAKTPAKEKIQYQEPSELETFYDRMVSLIRFNITFKLTLGFGFRLVSLIVLIFISVYIAFTYYLIYEGQNKLTIHENHVAYLLEDPLYRTRDRISEYAQAHLLSVHIFNSNHEEVFSTSDTAKDYRSALSQDKFLLRNFPFFPDIVTYRTLTSGVHNGDFFVVRMSMEKSQNVLEATFPISFVLFIAFIITAIRSSNRLATKHLRPIHTITEQVQEMSANNLSTRLNVSGTKDELKDLATTFNQMLDDIQQSYEREKQFVSDASHELRTPIAVIKGYAGMLNRWGKDDPNVLQESIDAIVGETDNMHSLVESLLFIARNDKGALQMEKNDFDFSHLLDEIIKETKLIDSDHNITASIAPHIVLYGSCEKLKQAIRIFMDNSIKYTPSGGKIEVSLTRLEKDVVLTLTDDGIGISKEDLPHIFDRFYRADKSRTKMKKDQHGGTGLGLSISKIIIEQHDGKIKVSSALNEGTQFKITLPISPVAH